MKKIIVIICLLLIYFGLQAAYLKNIPMTVNQPDGSHLKCFASGDEFFNRLHDADGYTIIQSQNDGAYYFAVEQNGKLVPSNYLAGTVNPKLTDLKPNLVISEQDYQKARENFWGNRGYEKGKAPHEGTLNNIVVYIRFSGQTEFTQTRAFFNGILNDQTVNANSVYNYYQEVSYNKLSMISTHFPTGTITTSYQDAQPIGYYQPYNATTNTIGYTGGDDGTMRRDREHTLLKNAVAFVSSQVSGSGLNIDADNDGYVDNVSFIIKGNVGEWASLLWPHRWSLYSQTVNIGTKRVYDYILMLSEATNYLNRHVFCHELFHALGAPDLYHYSDDGETPVGDWDIMESGSGHMGAYMKWKYASQKWITDIPVISTPNRYTVQPLTSEIDNSYKIVSPNSTSEFFVLENRRKTGTFETNLPGSGLLVYRINSAYEGNAEGNDEVYVYRPGGTTSTDGTVNNANFPTGTGITLMNNTTDPNPFLTNGTQGGLDLSNIVVNADNSISFDLFGGNTEPLSLPFTENFTALTIPTGWTQQNSSGVTDRWEVSTTNNAGGTANEMKAVFQQISEGTTRLVTPALNTSGYSQLNLNFKSMLDDYAVGATLKIQSSIDGVNWTDEAWSLATAGDNNIGPATINTTITNNVGSVTFVAFLITGDLYQFDSWYIDDITITAGSSGTAPVATTENATNLSTNSASLNGTVNANNLVTAITFEYGLTTSYGTTVNATPNSISGNTNTAVTAALSDLTPNTTYNFRVKAMSSGGTTYGLNKTFTTASAVITSLNETFEDNSTTLAAWTQEYVTGTKLWTFSTGAGGGSITTAHNGTKNAKFGGAAYGPFVTKLISPAIDISLLSNPKLTFWYGQQLWAPDQNELKVYYRLNSTSVWVEIFSSVSNIPAWTEVVLNLPVKSATYQITFEGKEKWGYANVVDDVVISGSSSIDTDILPKETSLAQNYPNPFNPATTINFALKENSQVSLTVLNAKGELVKELVRKNLKAGYHSIKFDGASLNSGVYFYKLITSDKTMVKKMIMVK